MSHAYPLGQTLEDALKPDAPAARTRGQAEEMATGFIVEALITDWLEVNDSRAEALFAAADNEDTPAHGHLQRYEDNAGHPVLAVTWWRLKVDKTRKAKVEAPKPPPPKPEKEDHTDDLYFRSGRTKPRRRKKIDPNQMDLFGTEDAE